MKLFKIEVISCLEDDISASDFPKGTDAIVSRSRRGASLNRLTDGFITSTPLSAKLTPAAFDLDEGGIALVSGEYIAKVGGHWVGCAARWPVTIDGRSLDAANDGVPYPLFIAERRASTSNGGRGTYSVWKTGPNSFETRNSKGSPMGCFEHIERADDLATKMADAYDARTLRGPGPHAVAVKPAPSFSDAQKSALKDILARRAICDRFLRFAETSRARAISPDRMSATGIVADEDVTVEVPLDVLQAALDDGSLERLAREWLASIDVAVEATYGIAITPSEA